MSDAHARPAAAPPAASADATPGDALLALAERLADAGRQAARHHFRTPVAVDDKPDASPVTIADREAESAMRRIIEEIHPDHGIVGEEHGTVRGDAEYVWVLDPIDGTKQFISGKPTFGCLIALVHRGRPVLGVIEMPALGERWVGAAGRPTLFTDAHGEVAAGSRGCARLDAATLCATSPGMFAHAADNAAFERLRAASKLTLYGGDCHNYGLLAAGYLDLVCEAGMSYYDFAALVPVIEGAGGVITDWRGRPLGPGSDGRVLAAGDRTLHAQALEQVRT
ncbi:histidinol-phosphatase [Rhodovibrio sodomensis]|uniref:histidinol-phosphatase n=1 Tax=Rhodovibrio sodomensis TaxID=1088 RepID=UPI003083F390